MTKSEIQLIRSLADKRARYQSGLFVAEGEKFIDELRRSHLKIGKIYATEGVFEGSDVEVVSPHEMERLSLLKSANSSLALVEMPRYTFDAESACRGLTLALDNIQNPGNMGTIIRLADWFGIENIVCSESTADCYNPKVVQATMGAIIRVKVHYTDLPAFLRTAKTKRVPIYGTFLEGDNIYHSTLSPTGIIVMGNEGQGISRECAAEVTDKLYIPPFPADRTGSESLNVAVATAIICSEFRRR